jgi:hypothetical protein
MKKILIPSPQLYSNAADFLSELIKCNKAEQSKFSYRIIANKLKWPLSYIPDVIAGRKAFTLLRALQFADYSKMSSSDKERLTWFALLENENEDVKVFFQKKLHLTPNDVLRPAIVLKDADLYNTTAAICSFLILHKRRMTVVEIMQGMYLPYLTKSKVSKCLAEIEKNQYLVWDSSGRLIENNANFIFDNFNEQDGKPFVNIELHKESAESFLKFIETPKAPSTYHSGIVQIRKGQFMSVALQMISLRNWLLDISNENISSANTEESHRLMQFDLNLFPVTDIC